VHIRVDPDTNRITAMLRGLDWICPFHLATRAREFELLVCRMDRRKRFLMPVRLEMPLHLKCRLLTAAVAGTNMMNERGLCRMAHGQAHPRSVAPWKAAHAQRLDDQPVSHGLASPRAIRSVQAARRYNSPTPVCSLRPAKHVWQSRAGGRSGTARRSDDFFTLSEMLLLRAGKDALGPRPRWRT